MPDDTRKGEAQSSGLGSHVGIRVWGRFHHGSYGGLLQQSEGQKSVPVHPIHLTVSLKVRFSDRIQIPNTAGSVSVVCEYRQR